MNPLFAIISALASLTVTELEQFNTISPTTGALVTGINGAIDVFVNTFKGGTNTPTAASILSAINASVTVLQNQTNIDPKALTITQAFLKAAQAGLDASNVTIVDPSQLKPIEPVA